MNKNEALQKIEELKNFIKQEETKWVKIGYDQIPKELFDKYNVKPFEIQKRKMRKDGEVWNEINYFDAQKECEKLGYRLPDMRKMLMLLEHYKNVNKEVSYNDKEFLGIEELSYEEDVCYEWIHNLQDVAFLRGGGWDDGASAGVFALYLGDAPTNSRASFGFRMCK